MKKFLIITVFLLSHLVSAVQMRPMEGEITIGKNKMVEFVLTNDLSYPIAMKVGIYERNPDYFGNEGKYKEASSKLFEVIKPNVILMPKGHKSGKDKVSVRVYFKGGQKTSREQAYRIIAQQMPVDLDRKQKNKNKLRFLAKFIGALYVTPKNAMPKLKLSEVKKSKGNISFSVENLGTRRDFIESLKVSFKGKNAGNKVLNKVFEGTDLLNIYHHTILSGKKRKFNFRIPINFIKNYPYAQNIEVSLK